MESGVLQHGKKPTRVPLQNHPWTPQLVSQCPCPGCPRAHMNRKWGARKQNSSPTVAINKTPIVLGWMAYSGNSPNKRDQIASVSYKRRHQANEQSSLSQTTTSEVRARRNQVVSCSQGAWHINTPQHSLSFAEPRKGNFLRYGTLHTNNILLMWLSIKYPSVGS